MVKFGEYISSIITSSKIKDKYIDYDDLKRLLDRMKNRKINASEEFYSKLDELYTLCKGFAEVWLQGLEHTIENGVYYSTAISDSLELNQFVFVNQEALRKIIKKHDKNMPSSRLLPVWRYKMDFHFTQRIIDVMFGFIKLQPKLAEQVPVTLPYSAVQPVPTDTFHKLIHSNDSNDVVVSINTTNDDIDDHHNYQNLKKQEDSFVRQSTKYWVKPCDLAAVCTILCENMQVHAFNDGNPWTPVSSVYLDNTSRECYTDRIRKDTGARIVRFRTYNNDTSRVFIERKVHQEKWTGEVSSKDRFAIDEDQIMPLLRGQTVRVSEKHQPLNTEIKTMIADKKMFPTLRIDYTRIAFQPDTHDHVRVSIDLNMRYIQERCSHNEWYTSDEKLEAEDQILFPYSIVEIKLREPYITSPPKWLLDLEHSALLHKENNFSKYIHGTYAFSFLKGNTLKLMKPLWWETMAIMSPLIPITSATPESDWEIKRKMPVVVSNSHWLPALFGITSEKDQHGAPVKIEPKVFFANERTFLVWFQSSLFVCSIGVALTSQRQSYAVGILLLVTGLLLLGYAVLTYLQRINSLLNKRSSGYHDKFGPLILTAIVATIFGASIGISINNAKNF